MLIPPHPSTVSAGGHDALPHSSSAPSSLDSNTHDAFATPKTVPPIEYVTINDNPFALSSSQPPKPTGRFGPLPMRTGYDKLLYGCGSAYLGGLSFGAVYGAYRGLVTAQVPSAKVRWNSIVNQTTRYGPWAANSMGVMTMGWAILDNALEAWRGGKKDYVNHVSAAFLSGFLFKCTAGVRPAVLTGSILAGVVSLYGVAETTSKHGLTALVPSFPTSSPTATSNA